MRLLLVMIFIGYALAAKAGEPVIDEGTTNPEELTIRYFADAYDFKTGKSTACVYGYWATKAGDHADAKKIFDKCAQANVDAAMIWQSYMYQNGFAVEQDPMKAAEWDKRAADRGYKVGQFNYGLSLLRGFGVKQDIAAGKALIDQSAAQGFAAARELADQGYNPSVAIPDAEEQRLY